MNAIAIDNLHQARPLMRAVCMALREAGGVDLGAGSWISLELCSGTALRAGLKLPYCRNPRGIASIRWIHENGRPAKPDFHIAIRTGLPSTAFAACCAHELGHIDMFRRAFPELPPLLREGLCELYKYTWLGTRPGLEAKEQMRSMEENPDPVYGDGFRAARAALAGRRLCEVVDHVAQFGQLPPRITGEVTHTAPFLKGPHVRPHARRPGTR